VAGAWQIPWRWLALAKAQADLRGPPHDPERQVKTVTRQVWVLQNGQPVAMTVTVGQTNGQHTEILGCDVSEGTRVLTEAMSASK
jgi:hypothetical protein